MANAERINLVIESIRGEQELTKGIGFNMADYAMEARKEYPDRSGRGCGTVACIAGHAYALENGGFTDKNYPPYDTHSQARDWLELNCADAEDLFYAYRVRDQNGGYVSMSDITPEHAIRVLEHLRDTGEVDWTR